MSDESAHDQAVGELRRAHLALEELVRSRVATGMSSPEEEQVVERIDAAYAWIATENIAAATSVAVAACSTTSATSPDGLFFPTVPRLDAYPSALLTAPLQEHAGCLFGVRGNQRLLLLWPDGYQATLTIEGWEVLDDHGAMVAREGQRMNLGGSETGAVLPADQQIPQRCGHHYWLVAPS